LKVELEFKRIQTYLFASPRLRAMLGANSVLGETIRIKLSKLAREYGATTDQAILPRLPEISPDDPLSQGRSNGNGALLLDDPKGVYREYGVLVRDGGHFIATFPDQSSSEAFVGAAYELIAEKLPGILAEARIDNAVILREGRSESIFQHPGFQVSHHMSNQPAAGRNAKFSFISAEEEQMEERGRCFRNTPADLIALLEMSHLIPCTDDPPQSLSELTRSGYIALIHADGNGMGSRYKEWQKRESSEGLAYEAHGEHFFHSMRVAVRRALVQALNEVFATTPESYRLLMLGGDDLLLACSAHQALPLVRAYAMALAEIELCDGKPLTIGAGVVIAKDSFPFHRLHEMAETLADSAKRLHRAKPEVGSVIDWHVSTNAWVNDPIEERRLDSLTDRAVLSGKPYPVLGDVSLDVLLTQARSIAQKAEFARSQLRGLVETMRQGPLQAELAYTEIPNGTREPLEDAMRALGQEKLFKELSSIRYLSRLPDLVELLEINRRATPLAKEHKA